MMVDGKALQMGTSHELGQNFARIFDIEYLDAEGTTQLAWTTSWGSSTRMVGGLIMAHGDDGGLRVPPRLAPTQVVVLLVKDDDGAGDTARAVAADLRGKGLRVTLDDRVDTSFGRRATDWELKGVPVRVEIGPRDLAVGQATVVHRFSATKENVALDGLTARVVSALDEAQDWLLAEATRQRDERTVDVATVEEALDAGTTGFARIPWSTLGLQGEDRLAESAISVRCLLTAEGGVPDSEDEPGVVAICGRSY
jgi:prolyl-tRNA synthetase